MILNNYLCNLNEVILVNEDHTKPPYIKKIDQRGDIEIWEVDGSYIRTNIDEEFTNFGQHFKFEFIPLTEFWIDQEASPDELQFFIEHLLVEFELMRKGVSYSEAIVEADKVEREERRKSGVVEKYTKGGTILPSGDLTHIRLLKKLESGVEVWLVDGNLVRSLFNIDFTQGGHEFVYEFCPPGEVFLDNDIKQYEWGYVILHELHERNLMEKGWPYSKAHESSSKIEFFARHNSDYLHDLLSKEGWS